MVDDKTLLEQLNELRERRGLPNLLELRDTFPKVESLDGEPLPSGDQKTYTDSLNRNLERALDVSVVYAQELDGLNEMIKKANASTGEDKARLVMDLHYAYARMARGYADDIAECYGAVASNFRQLSEVSISVVRQALVDDKPSA